jgi:membrane protein YqaA with SNARE-associated domain
MPENQSKNHKFRTWLQENSDGRLARWTLGLFSYFDGFISPFPPDPILALMSVFHPKKWWKYALATTILSVLGGITGYLIGLWLFESFGEWLLQAHHASNQIQAIGESFNNSTFLAIFIAAFTPIPYQIFTVAGGVFKVNFLAFLLASIIGRGLRFFIVAGLMRFLGEKFGNLMMKYFNWLLLFAGALLLIYLFFF